MASMYTARMSASLKSRSIIRTSAASACSTKRRETALLDTPMPKHAIERRLRLADQIQHRQRQLLASGKPIAYCLGDPLAVVAVHHVKRWFPACFRVTFHLALSPI